MKDFEFIVTDYEDYDNLVVEIWCQNNLVAIIKDNDELQLFDKKKNGAIIASSLFDKAIDFAKKKLKG